MTQADSVHSTPRTDSPLQSPTDDPIFALIGKFELLLAEYYERRRDWGPRLAQAHAETDALFGEEYGAPDRESFFSEACTRFDVQEASDRLQAVTEEMKPLARTIVALPTTSMEVLRAKALVTFWEISPLSADDTKYHFGDEYPFQLLFSAVAEFCGLEHKIISTGYTLPELPDPFSPLDEDDEEEA